MRKVSMAARAELVTDDAEKFREHLEQATGERISALEGIAAANPEMDSPSRGAPLDMELIPDTGTGMEPSPVPATHIEVEMAVEPPSTPQKERAGMDLEL